MRRRREKETRSGGVADREPRSFPFGIVQGPCLHFPLFFKTSPPPSSLFLFSHPTPDTMNASDPVDVAEIAKSKAVSQVGINEKDELSIDQAPAQQGTFYTEEDKSLDKEYPNDEDLRNLRRVAGKVPWAAYTIAFVELCERFSYYGTTAVCMFHCFQKMITRLIQYSRQLHSAPSTCWIYHWRPGPRLRFQQWCARCPGYGSTSLHRIDIV